jgi:hypothetical protein
VIDAFQKKSFGKYTKFHHSATHLVLTISLSTETARERLIEINVLFRLLKIVLILFIKGSSRVSSVFDLLMDLKVGPVSFVF